MQAVTHGFIPLHAFRFLGRRLSACQANPSDVPAPGRLRREPPPMRSHHADRMNGRETKFHSHQQTRYLLFSLSIIVLVCCDHYDQPSRLSASAFISFKQLAQTTRYLADTSVNDLHQTVPRTTSSHLITTVNVISSVSSWLMERGSYSYSHYRISSCRCGCAFCLRNVSFLFFPTSSHYLTM